MAAASRRQLQTGVGLPIRRSPTPVRTVPSKVTVQSPQTTEAAAAGVGSHGGAVAGGAVAEDSEVRSRHKCVVAGGGTLFA